MAVKDEFVQIGSTPVMFPENVTEFVKELVPVHMLLAVKVPDGVAQVLVRPIAVTN